MLTVGSLFSGIGGLECGLEMCGVGPVIWQAESDPYARAVLAKHWPTVHRYEDVREIDAQSPPPDIICGGFPCQDISNAGKRAGIGGARSGLWSEFARIVRDLRPRVVFVENVAALLARGIDVVLGDLAALGFDAEWGLFRASDVGAPHRRERVFILANATSNKRGLHARSGNERTRAPKSEWSSQGGIVADPNSERRQARRAGPDDRKQGRPGSLGDGHVFPPGPGQNWDGPQPAVRRGDDGIPRRVDRLKCLGNAVVPAQAALAWQTLSARMRL